MAPLIAFPNALPVVSTAVTPRVRRKGKILSMKKEAEFLTTEQVAKWFGYSVRTITDWAQQHEDSGGQAGIPAFKLGRGWRFDKTALEVWLADKQRHKEKLSG